ncbi:hypothetical protein BH10PLA2_BH10PLA2_30550 [soil metagenome]
MFKLRNPPSQFGVFRLKLRYPYIAWVVHVPQILATHLYDGKRSLTVTGPQLVTPDDLDSNTNGASSGDRGDWADFTFIASR